jgi:hypothetical protein
MGNRNARFQPGVLIARLVGRLYSALRGYGAIFAGKRTKALQTMGFIFSQRPRRGGRVVEGAPLLRE